MDSSLHHHVKGNTSHSLRILLTAGFLGTVPANGLCELYQQCQHASIMNLHLDALPIGSKVLTSIPFVWTSWINSSVATLSEWERSLKPHIRAHRISFTHPCLRTRQQFVRFVQDEPFSSASALTKAFSLLSAAPGNSLRQWA